MVLLIVASVFRVMWGRMFWHPQIRGRHICLLECGGAPSCPVTDSVCFYGFWKGSMFLNYVKMHFCFLVEGNHSGLNGG